MKSKLVLRKLLTQKLNAMFAKPPVYVVYALNAFNVRILTFAFLAWRITSTHFIILPLYVHLSRKNQLQQCYISKILTNY